jgi:hypothetical protein
MRTKESERRRPTGTYYDKYQEKQKGEKIIKKNRNKTKNGQYIGRILYPTTIPQQGFTKEYDTLEAARTELSVNFYPGAFFKKYFWTTSHHVPLKAYYGRVLSVAFKEVAFKENRMVVTAHFAGSRKPCHFWEPLKIVDKLVAFPSDSAH